MDTIVNIDSEHIGLKIKLPPTKNYHVFLYCEESDKQFADYLLKKLEQKGVKCCYCLRDFSPARTQIGNITEAIEQSVQMVIIISRSFFESREGMYAAEMHLQSYIQRDRSAFIPIKIDDCTVPLPFILNTINVRHPEADGTWFPKLIRSIADKTENYLNMKILASHRGVYCPKIKKKLEMSFSFIQQLQKEGIVMDTTTFNRMMTDIVNIFRDYCRPHKLLFPVFPYLFVICMIGIIASYTMTFFQYDILGRWLPLFLIDVFGLFFSIIMGLIMKNKLKDIYHTSYKSDLALINCKLTDNHILITIVEEEVKIVYYNYKPCRRYLKDVFPKHKESLERSGTEKLKRIYAAIKSWFCCDNRFKCKDTLKQIMIQESSMYACWYLRGKLANRKEERHTIEDQCLCQYIEAKWCQ